MIKRLKDDLKILGLDLVDYPGNLDKLKNDEVGYEARETGVDLYVPLDNCGIVLELLEGEAYREEPLDFKCTHGSKTTIDEEYGEIQKPSQR